MKKIKEIYSYYVLYITLKENEFLSFLNKIHKNRSYYTKKVWCTYYGDKYSRYPWNALYDIYEKNTNIEKFIFL